MAQPTSLLQGARAFARDYPRDAMPKGYLWDIVDYVPVIVDAPLTGRGGWRWHSTPLDGDVEAGIYADFTTGNKLFVQTTNGHLWEVTDAPPYNAVDRGVIVRSRQNPIQLLDLVVHLNRDGTTIPTKITAPGGVTTIGTLDATAPKARYGTIFKAYLVLGGAPGEEDTLRFSPPNNPTGVWYVNSFWRTSLAITGLAALRSVILVFHAGSVERIRGSIPPHAPNVSTNDDGSGDMFLEPLFARVGCDEPQTIAYWQDNVVFADQHGVHMTDGATVRNLVSQGGIGYFWRVLWENKITAAAQTFLDFYQVTVRGSDGTATTLVCDLARRQWVRFANIPALSYVASGGAPGMERLWAGLAGTNRLARVSACFRPPLDGTLIADDNGMAVNPIFDTPWYRMGQEGRKRMRFFYLSYDVRVPDPTSQAMRIEYMDSPEETLYTPIGTLPGTDRYRRYRLPLGRFPYGAAFRVLQAQPSSACRVYDLAVDAQASERGRV